MTELEKLQTFSNAQTNTIIELSKKLKGSQDEVTHLKKLLEGSVPLVKGEGAIADKADDREYICRTEISKLRDISRDRELNSDEARRFDIYCKILKELTNVSEKPSQTEAKKASTEELLALVTPIRKNE